MVGCLEEHAGAASRTHTEETVLVSVMGINGKTIWGPGELPAAGPVAELRGRVAKAVESPVAAVKLLNGFCLLDPCRSLQEVGVSSGASLTMVLSTPHVQAQRLLDLLDEIHATEEWSVDHGSLSDLLELSGKPSMPADVAALFEVFALAKRVPSQGSFSFGVEEFDGGLLHIAATGYQQDTTIVHLVDCEGRLAELCGQPAEAGRGAVWWADLWDTEAEGRYSLDFWRRPEEHGAPVERGPLRVAGSLTQFLEDWVMQGRPPTDLLAA